MAHRITAETNMGSYRPAYDHLNEHEPLGWSVKLVSGKVLEDWEGSVHEQWTYLTTSRPVTKKELVEGVLWKFRRECRCEHDCCGHWQAYASACRLRGNRRGTRWAVPIIRYRNI